MLTVSSVWDYFITLSMVTTPAESPIGRISFWEDLIGVIGKINQNFDPLSLTALTLMTPPIFLQRCWQIGRPTLAAIKVNFWKLHFYYVFEWILFKVMRSFSNRLNIVWSLSSGMPKPVSSISNFTRWGFAWPISPLLLSVLLKRDLTWNLINPF